MRNSAVHVAEPHFLAGQRAVVWHAGAEHDRQLRFIRVIDKLQICFLCRRTQQGFRHVSASLSKSGVNNQQRFHYALLLLVKRF